jgi:oxalate decarboxylase/phosphoglucose isomerase-like protein (cupin superfamily)
VSEACVERALLPAAFDFAFADFDLLLLLPLILIWLGIAGRHALPWKSGASAPRQSPQMIRALAPESACAGNAKIFRMKRQAFFCLIATLLVAQATAPEVEITAEPHHHLTLEKKSVRVFNVDVPPHGDTLLHWHRHDYVYVTLGDSEVVNAVKDKPPVTVKLQDGETRFSPATFAHIARNLADRPFRNVTIEILEDETLRNSTAKWDEDRALDILQGGTKQILFIKDGIRVSEVELQPNGVVPMHHHAGPHLLVAVTDLDLRSDVAGQGPMPAHFKSGDSKWLPGGYSHTVTNTGPNPAKFVTLEFP